MPSRGLDLFGSDYSLFRRSQALKSLLLARTCRLFELSVHRLLNSYFPQPTCFFLCFEGGSNVPAYLPDFRNCSNGRRRFREGLKDDIWYARHPPKPGQTRVVRHSDHTPEHVLSETQCYRQHLRARGHRFGLSLVFWSGPTLLSCITLLRPAHFGDYTDVHLRCLKAVYSDLLAEAVRNLTDHLRICSDIEALQRALQTSEEAQSIVCLPDRMVAASVQARRIMATWTSRVEKVTSHGLRVPEGLKAWVADENGQEAPNHKWHLQKRRLGLSRLTSQSYVIIRMYPATPRRRASRWNQLSGAEKDIVMDVTVGKTNREIADARKTAPSTVKNQISHILRKLGLKGRLHLAVEFSGLSPEKVHPNRSEK